MIVTIAALSIFIGVPISLVIGLGCMLWFLSNDLSLGMFVTRLFRSLDTFPLLAVPFFMLTGAFMGKGGSAKKLITFADVLVGHFKGGLAQINILVSMFFAGITGSAAADTSAVGTLLIPSMIEEGYERDFSVAVTATSSVIGVIIPPSIPIVMTAIVSNLSIGALLMAGIIPGILMGLGLMITTFFIAHIRNYPTHARSSIKAMFIAFIEAFPSFVTVLIIVGGIYLGVFTPTESAIIAAIYALILGMFVYKKIKIKDLPEIFISVAIVGGLSLFLYANSSVFSWIIAAEGVPDKILAVITSITSNKIIILLLINLVFILIGTIMDTTPAIILLLPIFMPIVTQLGMNPIHFGLVASVALSIGLATPPVGLCLFIASSIGGISVDKGLKALLPYIFVMIVILIVITFVPGIVMTIPNYVFPNM